MRELKRIREWMDVPGRFPTGPRNAITDVPGVTCAHVTIKDGSRVCTGVTLISPGGDAFLNPIPAAAVAGNGFGKLTGVTQIEELGEIESLIGLTNTLSVAAVLQGLVDYHAPRLPEGYNSINIVVGETNDGELNDIRGCHVTPAHVAEALPRMSAEVLEGAVGAGAGTSCFGFKGGIGTSSRVVRGKFSGEDKDYTVGAIVQSNYGGNLTVYGHALPLKELKEYPPENGSCMIVVATDAPLCCRQLKRLAKRGIVGLTNTGSYMNNGSGDYCVAWSNNPRNRRSRAHKGHEYYFLSDSQLNSFFEACADSVQEALYNSLTMAADTSCNGKTLYGFNIEEYRALIPLKK